MGARLRAREHRGSGACPMTQFLIYAGAFILVLVSVITVHEFGHFAVGKLSGIKVEEFSIGFGPKLYSRTVGETLYAIRAIPAGGFVRMAGMLGLTGESDAGDRNFYRASRPRRFATVSAGIISNFIFGALIFAIVGMQPTPYNYASKAAAGLAGLTTGDTIVSINGSTIRQDTLTEVTTDLHNATTASQGRPMTVVYRASDGSERTTTFTPTLTISNILANPANVAGGKLPVGGLAVTSIDGSPVGTGDPATLLGSGSTVKISGYLENANGSPSRYFTNVAVSGITDGYPANNAIHTAWIMGVVPGYNGESPPAASWTGSARSRDSSGRRSRASTASSCIHLRAGSTARKASPARSASPRRRRRPPTTGSSVPTAWSGGSGSSASTSASSTCCRFRSWTAANCCSSPSSRCAGAASIPRSRRRSPRSGWP